jgi:hypothetical protein
VVGWSTMDIRSMASKSAMVLLVPLRLGQQIAHWLGFHAFSEPLSSLEPLGAVCSIEKMAMVRLGLGSGMQVALRWLVLLGVMLPAGTHLRSRPA